MPVSERGHVPIFSKGEVAFLPGDVAAGIQNHAAGQMIPRLVVESAAEVAGQPLIARIDVLVGQSTVGVFRDVIVAIKQINSCRSSGNLHGAETGSAIGIRARTSASRRTN